MLRRVENVWVEFRYGLGFSTTGRARVHIGNQTVTFGWMKEREYHKLQVEQQAYPLRLAKIGERTYWQFQDRVYWENGASTPMRFHALLVSEQQRKRGRIERAQAMAAMGMQPQDQARRRDVTRRC
jgi:hypothetical protein